MSPTALVALVLALATLAYWFGQRRALALAVRPKGRRLHSRPGYHGLLVALWCAVPALCIVVGWQFAAGPILTSLAMDTVTSQRPDLGPDQLNLLVNELRNLVAGHTGSREIDPLLQAAADRYTALAGISRMALAVLALSVSIIAASLVLGRIHPALRARNQVEGAIEILLTLCSTFAVFITIGIVASVLFESIRFFQKVPFTEFLFGLNWSPQMAIRADQVGSSGSFGAVPVLTGTFLISAIAMSVAVPFGLMSAIYLSEYAGSTTRAIVKPLLEILAGVPTVVYGFFAALVVAPLIRDLGLSFGLSVSSESALAAGLVMGVMIIPFVSSLSDDVINAVPQSLRDGSYALGATRSRDHPAGGAAGRPAGHRRLDPAGRVAGHRRDHDRGHGRRPGRQPDPQPPAGGDHGDRADRHPAGRRPGVRQPQDAGRLCPGHAALRGHPGAQRHRPVRGPQIPGGI